MQKDGGESQGLHQIVSSLGRMYNYYARYGGAGKLEGYDRNMIIATFCSRVKVRYEVLLWMEQSSMPDAILEMCKEKDYSSPIKLIPLSSPNEMLF